MVEAKIHPTIMWAQRKDAVYITVCLTDLDKHEVTLTEEAGLTFNGNVKDKECAFNIPAFQYDIDISTSKWNVKGRNIIIMLMKKDEEGESWTRIQKDKVKNSKIETDWAKRVDSDEEDEEPEKGMEGMDMGAGQGFGGGQGGPPGMGGAGGMPGMGGMGGGGMPGMEQMMGGMGGGAGGDGGMGGMDMAKLQEMMAQMKGGGGMPGMEGMMGGMPGMEGGLPDSDDEEGEEEEAVNAPMTSATDPLAELDGEANNDL